MSKRLGVVCMALFLLVLFAVPARVFASPELTTSKWGPPVAVGTKFTGTNIGGVQLRNDDGTSVLAECSTGTVTGELTKNSGTEIEGNITTATFSGTGAAFGGMNECTAVNAVNITALTPTTNGGGVDGEKITNGTPWCLKTQGIDGFAIRGGKCSEATRRITMILDATKVGGGSVECKYFRVEPLVGTFTTQSTGDAIFSMSANEHTTFEGETGNDFIYCPSQLTLEWDFTLEKDEAMASPFYIS
jgi:hypothetical protein